MKLITLHQVAELVGKSGRTIQRWEEAGAFPKRRRLPSGRVAWVESEVLEWITNLPTVEAA